MAHKIGIFDPAHIDRLFDRAHKLGMILARTSEQIGNAIRRARKQKGLNQAALGDRAGLRQPALSIIERGNPAARIDSILDLLAALDLELQIAPRSKRSSADLEDLLS